MSGPYDKEDAADDTDVGTEEVSEAWHTARDDYEDLYGVDDRHEDGDDWGDHWGIEHDDGS